MKNLVSFCLILIFIQDLVYANIVLQDKKQNNHIVMTQDNIVLKGDFFGGGQQCDHSHTVEHVWLPMQQQHQEEHHGWGGNSLESRHYANYALPERREDNLKQYHQQNLNRLLFMLTQPNQLVPLVNYPVNYNQVQNLQRRQSTDDEASKEDKIDRIFEKHINGLEKEIVRS